MHYPGKLELIKSEQIETIIAEPYLNACFDMCYTLYSDGSILSTCARFPEIVGTGISNEASKKHTTMNHYNENSVSQALSNDIPSLIQRQRQQRRYARLRLWSLLALLGLLAACFSYAA